MDKSSLFDQKIRDAVNKHEVPFDDSLWKNIEKEINAPIKGSTFNWKPWAISASVAAALVIAYFAFIPNSETDTVIIEKNKVEELLNVLNGTDKSPEEIAIVLYHIINNTDTRSIDNNTKTIIKNAL